MSIAIIKYNAGNTASVANALLRLGITPTITDDVAEIRAASHVIFPGVGHAQPAMAYLRERGLDTVIRSLTQPFLGICLGLQLLCEWSEEGDTTCIGIFPHKVRRFPPGEKVPHMGWNHVPLAGTGCEPWRQRIGGLPAPPGIGNQIWDFVEDSSSYQRVRNFATQLAWPRRLKPHVYYLHAYRADLGPTTIAACDYGGPFSAIMRKDNFLATQFHPEKSDKAGARLLRSFVAS